MPPPSADKPPAPVSEKERRAAWRAFYDKKKITIFCLILIAAAPQIYMLTVYFPDFDVYPILLALLVVIALPFCVLAIIAAEFAEFHGVKKRYSVFRLLDHPLYHPQWRHLKTYFMALMIFVLSFFAHLFITQ